MRKWQKYDDVLDLYDRALMSDPKNVHILIHKSFLLADKGDGAKVESETISWYNRAKRLMDAAIEIDRDCAGAYYNRACYCCLLNRDKEEIMQDLGVAIDKDELFAKMAVADEDLKSLWKDDSFTSIINSARQREEKN